MLHFVWYLVNANNALPELQLETLNLPPADSLLDLPPDNEADADNDEDNNNNIVVAGPRFQAQVELAATIGNYSAFHSY